MWQDTVWAGSHPASHPLTRSGAELKVPVARSAALSWKLGRSTRGKTPNVHCRLRVFENVYNLGRGLVNFRL